MDFVQVDVFTEAPYRGNPLAVFPDAGELTRAQMQAVAREMNLSETTFVTSARADAYEVRIFTPEEELPFAGHPTLGTAWVLRDLGVLRGDDFEQRSAAGTTRVWMAADERVWFERSGEPQDDLESRDPAAPSKVRAAVRLDDGVGMEAREMGRAGRLRPAVADAGVPYLIVPVQDVSRLEACRPDPGLIAGLPGDGLYCFTAVGAGHLRARGFFPSVGIPEDPATGSAAAALGVYLAERIGDVDLVVEQGVEVRRPSRIHLRSDGRRVEVGGRCVRILRGRLDSLP